MSGLLEEALAEKNRPGGRCTVGKFLQSLPDVDLDADDEDDRPLVDKWREVLANPSVENPAIERLMLRKFGPGTPKEDAIRRHRKGRCMCTEDGIR